MTFMHLAVNYSHPATALLCDGRIMLDRFKCPAWPDLIAEAQQAHPVYVHFPLKVGLGIGDALDTETKQPADWHKVETLLRQTDTPFVNLHIVPRPHDYPDMPADTTDPADCERIVANTLRDVRAVIARFGVERVIVENEGTVNGLRPAFMPDVIHRIVTEAGCGFLCDLSHARLIAKGLGIAPREYIAQLPMQHVCEMHVTGIQRFEGRWLERARSSGTDEAIIQQFAGRDMDHLPMTDADWEFFTWALAQIRSGAWATPWVVSFEYGGVGGVWEAITDAETLAVQVPRLCDMIHQA
ncbi:MAG: DUF692 family multinuclear iron-containing protein [Chloroflexota bacterium]